METFDIVTIDRHRFHTDGKGVTTLVILNGCPLRCRYCINGRLLSGAKTKKVTVEELIQRIMQDYCYFMATGGGITFGGGEPLLYYEAIMAFIRRVNGMFATTIETSLAVDVDVAELLKAADQFIIDVKSIDGVIYREYTGTENEVLLSNLKKISGAGLQDKCVVRIPDIKGFTAREDVECSVHYIRDLGFENIDRFTYKVGGQDERFFISAFLPIQKPVRGVR